MSTACLFSSVFSFARFLNSCTACISVNETASRFSRSFDNLLDVLHLFLSSCLARFSVARHSKSISLIDFNLRQNGGKIFDRYFFLFEVSKTFEKGHPLYILHFFSIFIMSLDYEVFDTREALNTEPFSPKITKRTGRTPKKTPSTVWLWKLLSFSGRSFHPNPQCNGLGS